MASTENIPANKVQIGDVIVCSNGSSITVEKIIDAGEDIIEFAGTQTFYSFVGIETSPDGMYEAFWNDLVTVQTRR